MLLLWIQRSVYRPHLFIAVTVKHSEKARLNSHRAIRFIAQSSGSGLELYPLFIYLGLEIISIIIMTNRVPSDKLDSTNPDGQNLGKSTCPCSV